MQRSPLIFVSDWFRSPDDEWHHQLNHFQAQYECLPWSLPGHAGATETPRSGQPVFDQAIAALTTSLVTRERPVHLVGHGLGALVALRAASHCMDRVRSLVLISPVERPIRGRWLMRLAARASWFVPLYLFLFDPLVEGLPAFVRLIRRSRALKRSDAALYFRSVLALSPYRPPFGPGIPVYVITGDRNPLGSTSVAESWNECLERSQLIRYAHLGHDPHREEPELVNRALGEFFYAIDRESESSFARMRAWLKNLIGRRP
ncbi:MAG: alpha/beta hydrolase [Spirochaetales bacterium]|nr:alpha/beta hydrolase [Leptospiraceae bacterium]MCP5479890.1 alpha/beta hydrolase [Spirochaetales bacterium]MCP5486280.1 alpha/beta hydrolase [Spirochaetales bacterium]